MLVQAEHDAFTRCNVMLDWDHPATILVGSREDDRGCAQAAGIKFAWACDWFDRPAPHGAATAREDTSRWRVRACDVAGTWTFWHYPNDTLVLAKFRTFPLHERHGIFEIARPGESMIETTK
jgi:hypothetical protein